MLLEIIKKMHKRIIFSLYGILTMITMLLPFVMIGIGIVFTFVKSLNIQNGWLWIVFGLILLLFGIRKFKDFLPTFQYAVNPKKYPLIQKLMNESVDLSQYDEELKDANVLENLNKKNPFMLTENLALGYSQVSFFVLRKEDVLWAYEYNGNGLVLYDTHQIYGFTFFPTVDGNDEAIALMKHDMPYIYFETEFDYKKVMHDDFDNTVIEVRNERLKYLADPENYREEKERVEREKIEEETRRLEEEKNKELESLGLDTMEDETTDEPIEEVQEVVEEVEEETEKIEE